MIRVIIGYENEKKKKKKKNADKIVTMQNTGNSCMCTST